MKGYNEITIGVDVCYWRHTEGYTLIYDEEYSLITSLAWEASEKEIKAAIYGYSSGFKQGKKIGKLAKQEELKKVLGIKEN